MRRNTLLCRFLLATCLCLVSVAHAASVVESGDPLPSLALKDQHDKPAEIAQTTQLLIFAADNSGGQKATALIDRLGASWLKETRSVYLADIHRMPGLIASMFALPQLRDKPYSIVLGREAADLAMLPRKQDCVTLMQVRQGILSEPVFACSEEELQAAVGR